MIPIDIGVDTYSVLALGWFGLREVKRLYLRGYMAKLIVAGSRSYNDKNNVMVNVFQYIDDLEAAGIEIDEIVHGGCPTGVDSIANEQFKNSSYKMTVFKADWLKHGRAAGPIRNREMAKYGDYLIAFVVSGKSPGTISMIKEMKAVGKEYLQIIVG